MLTVVTRWETSQLDPRLEWRMWRQLKGAFKIDKFIFTPDLPEMANFTFEQYPTMEEALAASNGKRVFLEPGGEDSVLDIPANEDIVLVLGSTELGNAKHVTDNDLNVCIKTVKPVDFYGTNAAAIALAYMVGQ